MESLVKPAMQQQTSVRLVHTMPNLLDDFLGKISSIGVKDIERLASFVPVIVLVPGVTPGGELGSKKRTNKASPNPTVPDSLAEAKVKPLSQLPITRAEPDFVFGEVSVNFSTMEVIRKGVQIVLTALEFKFLKYMIQNERRMLSRDELLNEVWGYEHYPCTRTVDNHILRLRHKLERDPSRPTHFRTVHGSGYKFTR